MSGIANTTESGTTAEPAEIEVTPEMIEAGIAVLFDYDPAFSNEAETVSRIFSTMLSKRPSRSLP